MNLWEYSEEITCDIPLKLPSLNDYVNACRSNRYEAAEMKRRNEDAIMLYLLKLPRFENPVYIEFCWTENNKKRDFDNIAFAKKFILDALVKAGKLKDDNRRFVLGFNDRFVYGTTAGVKLRIYEVESKGVVS